MNAFLSSFIHTSVLYQSGVNVETIIVIIITFYLFYSDGRSPVFFFIQKR